MDLSRVSYGTGQVGDTGGCGSGGICIEATMLTARVLIDTDDERMHVRGTTSKEIRDQLAVVRNGMLEIRTRI